MGEEDASTVLMIGAGVGGMVAANTLARMLAPEVDTGAVRLVLADRSADHYYQPDFLFVAAGLVEPGRTSRPVRELLDRRVRFVQSEVETIDLDHREARLPDGSRIGFDYLVLSPGVRLDTAALPGLALAQHFYSLPAAVALREAFARLDGGEVVVAVSALPYKCPPAPLEMVLLFDSILRETGKRSRFHLTYAYPLDIPFPGPGIAAPIAGLLKERDIAQALGFSPAAVDAEHRVLVSAGGARLAYDLAVVVPPNRPDRLVERSGLAGGDGWMPADQHTLAVPGMENVYALGDAAGLPASKNGSGAEVQASVVARRIRDTVRGVTPTAVYQGQGLAFMVTDLQHAALMSADYQHQPSQFLPSRAMHWMKLVYNELYWNLTARALMGAN